MGKVIGIDLGTTNSCVYIMKKKNKLAHGFHATSLLLFCLIRDARSSFHSTSLMAASRSSYSS